MWYMYTQHKFKQAFRKSQTLISSRRFNVKTLPCTIFFYFFAFDGNLFDFSSVIMFIITFSSCIFQKFPVENTLDQVFDVSVLPQSLFLNFPFSELKELIGTKEDDRINLKSPDVNRPLLSR